MAMEGIDKDENRKRRRKMSRKLEVDAKVEVRSMDIGFQGSWHPGTVTLCEDLQRHVRYKNSLVVDNEVDYLEEVVIVSKTLDGYIESTNCYARGSIRPLPPLVEFDRGDLIFGLCVDVKYQESWWEGVIFDHCDGMDMRCVFFPDLGDEMLVGIHQLRITQDWNEITEEWTRRGNWVFLDLVEEQKRKLFVSVSVKQIWYDIRIKEKFEAIREWTCNFKYLWTDLIMEVINHYLSPTVKENSSVLNLPGSLLNEAPQQEFAEGMVNVDMNMIWPDEETVVQKKHVPPVKETLPEFQNEISPCNDRPFEESVEERSSSHLRSTYWKPVKFSKVELCPDAVGEYPLASKRDVKAFWMDKLQKHLVCIGWKIEWSNRLNVKRYKYISPPRQGQKFYLSLLEVCKAMKQDPSMNSLHLQNDRSIMHPTVDCHLSDVPANPVQNIQNPHIFPPPSSSVEDAPDCCPGAVVQYYWKPVKFSEVELCPDAVREYPLASKRDVRAFWMDKLQKHLVCIGWKIEWSNRFNVKRYKYIAPHRQGQKSYLSLLEVCKAMKQDSSFNSLHLQNDRSIMHPTVDCHLSDVPANPAEKIQNPDTFPPVECTPDYCPGAVVQYYRLYISNKSRAEKREWILKAKKHLLAEGWVFDYPPPLNKRRGIIYMSPKNRKFSTLHAACKFCIEESIPNRNLELQSMDEGASSCKSNQKKKRERYLKANIPKCQSKGLPQQVLRSNKRVQKVSGPANLQHKPLNIPSYLIDNNNILPRSKVYYKTKGRHSIVRTLAEGKITHDGIKCNCCLALYSFAGFENHASGLSTCKPSASIFLQDGKSLLDCQIQMMQDHRKWEASGKSLNDIAENDYICSVCHYGGELILCDKCPSSFHKTCLGLEDIPEGDWFCPSCRCGICGQRKIDGNEVEHFLSCVQCEHKYHVRCLKQGAADTSSNNGNWFCGKGCEKVYEGLHKLLGEPVPVANNLTWTLVKFIDPNSSDLGNVETDLMAESYSKLNLALSLMHECFEPLKESLTSRDLVEDVIFSRWSELNRINCQGFYTVLLERNEELISVATVRVHGKKVAEIPLVGTRLQYRRHGMCRIVIDELEKKLMQLDVERLILPAVPSVLETWTGSFGFAEMTNSERSQFLDYTFLDFEGTIMCQKLLINIGSSDSVC
ncbi:unnamed protein product [Sphenostylis stenocarpa]|uniref:Uncharacterized protein n=1 Tax=Sphenostylis stenocarpa TaxID=92480 RepID=A0AA87B9C0_9FABA|nr:unnamed protein product [Sphenostylis stenocarpa]